MGRQKETEWKSKKKDSWARKRPFPSSPEPLYQNKVKSSAFHRKGLCTWPHFESEGFWNSEVAYSVCEGNKIESCLHALS